MSSSSSHPDAPATAPLRILIADDNQDAALSLAMLLQFSGHETHVVHDGEAAVQSAERLQPDVVLLDIGMPKINGHEAARRIRQQPWSTRAVLIALTGWGQEEHRAMSTAAGFDHHLVKPVDLDSLTRLLAAGKRS